jgi:hypothetical protein
MINTWQVEQAMGVRTQIPLTAAQILYASRVVNAVSFSTYQKAEILDAGYIR